MKTISLFKITAFYKVLLITGPSGVGKTTVIRRLLETEPGLFRFSVSCTTREKRPGEVDGRDYHFVTKDAFEEKIGEKGFFFKYGIYNGNYYGTPLRNLFEDHKTTCILDTGKAGAVELLKHRKRGILPIDSLVIGLKASSLEVLRQRLNKRGDEDIEARLEANRVLMAENNIKYDAVFENLDSEETAEAIIRLVKKHFNLNKKV